MQDRPFSGASPAQTGASDTRAAGEPATARGDELDRAFEALEREAPSQVSRALHWLRKPEARKVRLPLGVSLILLSALWFLPVLGIEFLPIGLLLVAQDIPFLRQPVGHATLWLARQWIALSHWWRQRD